MEKCCEDLFAFKSMAEGGKDAFRYFFEKYYIEICDLVNFYIRDPEMSEEIAQDIFVQFWEKREAIKIITSVKLYLLKTAKNKALNYIRNKKNKLKIHEVLINTGTDIIEYPENNMDIEYIRELLKKAEDSLPPRCRKIFILAKKNELSYKEIAEELEISVKTVENQISKALKKLKDYTKPYYNEIS